MPQPAAPSGKTSSPERALRPLPRRLTRAAAPPIIVISDSDRDNDSGDEIVFIKRPEKRQRVESSTISSGTRRKVKIAVVPTRKAPHNVTRGSSVDSYSETPGEAPLSDSPSERTLTSEPAASGSSQQLEEVNHVDGFLAQLLEIVPDVEPDYARSLLIQEYDTHGKGAMDVVLHSLFESTSYPKIDRKGKGKCVASNSSDSVEDLTQIGYGKRDREHSGGTHYNALALHQLRSDYPDVAKATIGDIFKANNKLYAPTFFALRQRIKDGSIQSAIDIAKAPVRVCYGKGKKQDAEFERELVWVIEKAEKSITFSQEDFDDGEIGDDSEGGQECGCCFSPFLPEKMMQCPEGHLFCGTCIRNYASTKLGEMDPYIACMDQSGCKVLFAEPDLKRFLDRKLRDLYERLKQIKEIEAAGIEGLEECPFCEYKVIIENEEEKLVVCARDDCGAVSCRACKKLDHLPKSCQEAEEDKGLNARHKVEEAMTSALMRNCPKCKKAFIKESGCNKMRCPNCQTLSCYVCKQIIQGYEHFEHANRNARAPAGETLSTGSKKCMLWEEQDSIHLKDVTAAREQAIREMAGTSGVDRVQLEVELPKAVPIPSQLAARLAGAGVARARVVPHQVHHHYHHAPAPHVLPMNGVFAPVLAQPRYPLGLGLGGEMNPHAYVAPPPYQNVLAPRALPHPQGCLCGFCQLGDLAQEAQRLRRQAEEENVREMQRVMEREQQVREQMLQAGREQHREVHGGVFNDNANRIARILALAQQQREQPLPEPPANPFVHMADILPPPPWPAANANARPV